MEENWGLPKITVFLWIIRTVIIFTALAIVLISLKFYLAIVFSFSLAGIIIIYLLLFLGRYKITLLNDFFVLKYGVVFSVTRILPINKIIYIKILKTPVLKAFDLNLIIIKTIKGILILPELECDKVNKIKEKIGEKNL